jgi:hypothetical protein
MPGDHSSSDSGSGCLDNSHFFSVGQSNSSENNDQMSTFNMPSPVLCSSASDSVPSPKKQTPAKGKGQKQATEKKVGKKRKEYICPADHSKQ